MPRAPRYLPTTTSISRTGIVMSSSIVPLRRSSATRPMAMAGAAKVMKAAVQMNISRQEAWPIRKKRTQNTAPTIERPTTVTRYAAGPLK
ncbi:MAG: hypothetical protein M5U28_49875 [Sandaracinaceae bacterium]|nr:hypothetical protein [Sandaracinaceae bacterium]